MIFFSVPALLNQLFPYLKTSFTSLAPSHHCAKAELLRLWVTWGGDKPNPARARSLEDNDATAPPAVPLPDQPWPGLSQVSDTSRAQDQS